MEKPLVRPATRDDIAGMAKMHVLAWRQTYRGLLPDAVLDAPEAEARREQMWGAVVSDGFGGTTAVAVAERNGELVGIASAGTPRDDDASWPVELFTLYLLAHAHGSGAASELLDGVIGDSSASLWVADPNPRAQAFYRKSGFRTEGAVRTEAGVREIRMVRP